MRTRVKELAEARRPIKGIGSDADGLRESAFRIVQSRSWAGLWAYYLTYCRDSQTRVTSLTSVEKINRAALIGETQAGGRRSVPACQVAIGEPLPPLRYLGCLPSFHATCHLPPAPLCLPQNLEYCNIIVRRTSYSSESTATASRSLLQWECAY